MEAATVPPPLRRRQRRKKTQDHTNTTTTTISDLPSHITCDVLSRLPLNSIFYCKRLCSSFRNPTLEPYFPQLHLPRSPLSLILYRPSDFEHPIIFGYLPLDDSLVDLRRGSRWTMKFETKIFHLTYFEFLRIVSSCNGLIFLSDAKRSNNVCVCNPITRQHFFLPQPEEDPDPCLLRRGQYFCCGYGFGYSRSTDLFKVVKFTANELNGPSRLRCCVYTLGVDDEWRTLGSTGQPVPYDSDLPFVFLNGALHWISWERSTWLLCYFDMEKEQCGNQTFRLHSEKLISAVPSPLERARFHLGVVDNCLYIRHEQTSPLPVNIWVMKDYGDIRSWNLEWIIQRPLPSGLNQDLKPVKTLEDGILLMTVRKKVLASYNPVTKVLQRVSYHGVQFWEDLIVGVLSFLPLPCKNHQLKILRCGLVGTFFGGRTKMKILFDVASRSRSESGLFGEEVEYLSENVEAKLDSPRWLF